MVDRFGPHRSHDRYVIGDLLQVRQQVANPSPVLATTFATPQWFDDGELTLTRRHPGQSLPAANGIRQIGAVQLFQFLFVIKQVNVTRSARLKQVNDSFGFGGKVWQLRG